MTPGNWHIVRLATVAPALLLILALTQWLHVSQERLTPWKGGGFGMFSTVDSRQVRFVRCFLAKHWGNDILQLQIQVPKEWTKHLDELAYMPTEKRANELAHMLATASWAQPAQPPDPGMSLPGPVSMSDTPEAWVRGLPSTKKFGDGVPVEFGFIIIEAWTSSFDPASGRLKARKLVEITAPRASRG